MPNQPFAVEIAATAFTHLGHPLAECKDVHLALQRGPRRRGDFFVAVVDGRDGGGGRGRGDERGGGRLRAARGGGGGGGRGDVATVGGGGGAEVTLELLPHLKGREKRSLGPVGIICHI